MYAYTNANTFTYVSISSHAGAHMKEAHRVLMRVCRDLLDHVVNLGPGPLLVHDLGYSDPWEDPKSSPQFWILILLWCRLQNLSDDLLLGSARRSGLSLELPTFNDKHPTKTFVNSGSMVYIWGHAG